LFPQIDDSNLSEEEAFEKMGLELVGIEYDPRSLILDLKTCFLEARRY
jgi:hypothetical protein